MNNCNFIGRLTRDPEVRYSQGEKPICVARFTLAVERERPLSGFPLIQGIRSQGRIC